MGRRTSTHSHHKSHTLPSSPTHSSSSSDFEFTISLSPRKSSAADELFYKGQLLPLHLSPRLSMVRTLLLASSSTSSSSDTTTTASRDSSSSSTDCDTSARPSSATEEDDHHLHPHLPKHSNIVKKTKYFSLSRFSSVFRKEPKSHADNHPTPSIKHVITKYLKKVKPLYEKLSQKHQQKMGVPLPTTNTNGSVKAVQNERNYSFSGNLRYPRRRSCVSSCPSSMRSSPSHSGILSRNGHMGTSCSDASSMEELQSAIQGAIAHCKNSMGQNKSSMVSNEI